jgi:hypothetical protein
MRTHDSRQSINLNPALRLFLGSFLSKTTFVSFDHDMNPLTVISFNKKLAEIFSNGKGEVGLEVGTDPGLNYLEYVQIPRCMIKHWIAKIDIQHWNEHHPEKQMKSVGPLRDFVDGKIDVEYFKKSPGWVVSGKIRICNGVYECLYQHGTLLDWVPMVEFYCEAPTVDDIKAFYSVNVGHVRDMIFDQQTLFWVHAVRFWTTVSGLVISEKSTEYTFVDNPSAVPNDSNEFVEYVMNFMPNSLTAAAARATSWRKSNHATGGDLLSGFPRRWCQKEGFLKDLGNKSAQREHERNIVSAFYVATHAASVHTTLAMMAPTDETHWSIIDPCCGMIMNWEVGQSTIVRMAPKTQVAGTAIVVDAMVVLRMMTAEGLSPLLTNVGQIRSLKNAEDDVKTYGTQCAVYAKWFLSGHPKDIKPIDFNQRSEAFLELASELAIIGTKYYIGSTISESPALQNLVRQSTNESIKQSWAAIALRRREIGSDDLVKVIDLVKGNSALPIINQVLSEDQDIYEAGITQYNGRLRDIAEILGIPVTNEIRP